MARVRVYLNPFNAAGNAYTGFVEVSRDVIASSLGSIKFQLDVSEYDVGIFANSSVSISLRNNSGLYADVGNTTSVFFFKRADSLVKITWDAANVDWQAGFARANQQLNHEITLFQGILNDDSTVMQLADQTIDFQLLGYESIFDRVLIDSTWAGSLPGDYKASTLLKRILAISAASTNVAILTVDATQIVPSNDVTWDSIAVFTNKTAKEAINLILTGSNSVLYMNGTTPIVSGRTAAGSVSKHFYGPASTLGPENIQDIQNVASGLNRTFNTVTWTDSNNPPTVNLSSIDAGSVTLYGTRKKNVTVDGITTTATQQSVIDGIRTEFATPKQELMLYAPLANDTASLFVLNRVDIDYPLVPIDPNLALYGAAIYGTDNYPINVSTFVIDQSTPYKIIGLEIDPVGNKIGFNLRTI